ncbi:uncharacterized protein LOC128727626 [Anopheles nili]|uniref:uncharacterized protein LOC128727626 n=1 Tax=Anopheles nili TaxID=185578 RepID=UPI00237A8249|nr:uncharacterized protein LOC128727626 [Anopheles nili]
MSTQNTNYQLPILLQMQHNLTGQDVTSNALDRVEESDESSDSINLDSDQKILSNESSDESEQIEAENTSKLSSVPDASFKHKLYTQAPVTLEYNSYKDSIVPLLDTNPSDVRISVAMCTLGSREPNKTDCFKYFVCNPHNGAFQSFTCPSFTAFNKDSRLCDTASYQVCMTQKIDVSTNRPAILYKGSLSQHSSHLSKNDLLTAQKYAELIRLEANKLLTRNSMPLPPEQVVVMPGMHTVSTAVLDAVKPTGKIRRKSSSGKKKHAQITTMTSTTTTTATPTAKCCNSVRKAPRCRAEGRVPNPMDEYSYYVCHRKNQRKFVKMKITCPSGQKYCAASQYCTSSC